MQITLVSIMMRKENVQFTLRLERFRDSGEKKFRHKKRKE